MSMLEAGEPFSLRAVARRAGVSATAPYRHFADRAALESALAARGMEDLKRDLLAVGLPSSPEDLADLAVAYVHFALRRPDLFRLMFGNECDTEDDARVQAAAGLHELLEGAMARLFPGQDPEALAAAAWGLAHGLAFLHLDGKLAATPASEMDDRVRGAVRAIVAVRQST